MSKKLTPLQEAENKFKETGSQDDELVYLRLLAAQPAKVEVKAEEKTLDLAQAIIHAVNKSQQTPMRETKQHMDKIILCDEVILERSEKDASRLTMVETIREGVSMSISRIAVYNRAILSQTRAKVLIPQKDKDKFIESISKEIKKQSKEK